MSSTNETKCADVRTLLGGYVLHALEPDEAESVQRHLESCPACAAEHSDLMTIPALLDVVGAAETATEQPPAALEEAVLDRFAREHPGHPGDEPQQTTNEPRARKRHWSRRFATRPLTAALAGAVAAAAITALLIALPGGTGGTGNGAGPGEQYQATLSGSPAAPGASANANLKVVDSGTKVHLRVRGLHGSPDSVYELWCLRDDGAKVSAGTFRTDASGRADVSLTTAAVPGEYHRLGVEQRTLPPSGRPGVSVMAGEIQFPHS